MSTAAGTPPNSKGAKSGVKSPDSKDKGKGKAKTTADAPMEEEDDDDDDDDEGDEMEEDNDEDEDEDEDEGEEGRDEINPSAIIGRRTRGVKVDYTSKEALEKAGLTGNEEDDDDDEMKD